MAPCRGALNVSSAARSGLALVVICVCVPAASASIVVIPDVPSYTWYHGCGPTSGGMLVGYWDAHGFSNLIPGSNDWNTNRQAIEDMIASPGHIRDYVPTPDRTPTPEDPYHPDDCVADFNYCSRQPDTHGWSYFSNQDNGVRNYATYRGYAGSIAYNVGYYSLWDAFVASIDDNHPMEFLVDRDGNGSTDHFVAAIGYDDTSGAERYACYDTWSHNLRWCSFIPVGNLWGVHGGTYFHPVPEPATLALIAAGAGIIAVCTRRR